MADDSKNQGMKQGDEIPAVLIKRYSDIVKRAVEDPDTTRKNLKDLEQQDYFHSLGVAENTASKIETNKQMMELFPDIEIATDIRVSAIIDPNGQEDETLRIRFADSSAPSETIAKLIAVTKNFTTDINLKEIVKESRVDKGAWIEATIPEPLLDKIILANIEVEKQKAGTQSASIDMSLLTKKAGTQSAKEEYIKNFSLGIFDKAKLKDNAGLLSDVVFENIEEKDKNTVLEFFKINDSLISDNILSIKTVQASLQSATASIKGKLDIFKKPRSKITEADVKNIFSPTKKKREDFMALPAVKATYNKGKSLNMKLPVASTIPIYPSGDPSKHLGYLLLINPKTGVQIRDSEFTDRVTSMEHMYQADKITNENYLKTISENLKGFSGENKDVSIRDVDKIYSRLLDLKIKSVLKDTVFDDIVEVDIDSNDAYRVMLSRILESKETKMIFIPKELVSYIAFEYRENGTGKSILEKIAFFASLRAIVLFTNLMAKMSNSMTNTVVNAEIDELDRNAKGTRNSIISNYMNSRGHKVPLYTFNPRDLASWANMFGIQFNIKHPSFGNTEVSIEEKTGPGVQIDTELEDLLFQQILYAIGINKETVDAVKNEDYATAVTARSKFFAKRTAADQRILTPQTSELIKRRISYNILAYDQFRDIVAADLEKLKDKYLNERLGEDDAEEERKAATDESGKEALIDLITELLIDDIEHYLPKPEVTDDANNKTVFENFKDSLDIVVDSIVSDDMIVEGGMGDLNGNKEDIRKIVKSVATMKFLRDNNHLSDVVDMFTLDKEGKILLNPIGEYANMIQAFASAALESKEQIAKSNIKINKKNAALDEKLNIGETDDIETGGTTTDTTSNTDIGSTNDFSGGDAAKPIDSTEPVDTAEDTGKNIDSADNTAEDDTKTTENSTDEKDNKEADKLPGE